MAQSDEHLLEVIHIMNDYAQVGEPVSVSEVAEMVDFSEDTVRRKMDALKDKGWAYKKGKFYFIFIELGQSPFYNPDDE